MNSGPAVAILGATSHIAKGLIAQFLQTQSARLVLFGRSAERIRAFLKSANCAGPAEIMQGYDEFDSGNYDVIINCVGAGSPRKLGSDRSIWFTLTEEFDNLVLHYLRRKKPAALYINFSSGAIYGRNQGRPFREEDHLSLPVNGLVPADYYTVARLNAEAKHRSMSGLRIVDLRIFAYFSRYAECSLGYFMTDVLQAILEKRELETRPWDMVRDYADPEDLFALIRLCIGRRELNTALDVYSAAPVGKFELLTEMGRKFGLRYRLTAGTDNALPNGEKTVYCSQMHRAADLGYRPRYTSLAGLLKETGLRLEMER